MIIDYTEQEEIFHKSILVIRLSETFPIPILLPQPKPFPLNAKQIVQKIERLRKRTHRTMKASVPFLSIGSLLLLSSLTLTALLNPLGLPLLAISLGTLLIGASLLGGAYLFGQKTGLFEIQDKIKYLSENFIQSKMAQPMSSLEPIASTYTQRVSISPVLNNSPKNELTIKPKNKFKKR